MSKELKKELLLRDLSARLPYGVICDDGYGNVLELIGIDIPNTATFKCSEKTFWTTDLDKCKPYLYPISSMTEEQLEEFYCKFVENEINFNEFKKYYYGTSSPFKLLTSVEDCPSVIEWFIKNRFDYNGLIPIGLAVDCSTLNIYQNDKRTKRLID